MPIVSFLFFREFLRFSQCFFFFLRISVLSNQITCVASKKDIICRALPSFTNLYHFRDITKMIIDVDILRLTGLFRTLDSYSKILPTSISAYTLQFTCVPHLHSRTIVRHDFVHDTIERRFICYYALSIHFVTYIGLLVIGEWLLSCLCQLTVSILIILCFLIPISVVVLRRNVLRSADSPLLCLFWLQVLGVRLSPLLRPQPHIVCFHPASSGHAL